MLFITMLIKNNSQKIHKNLSYNTRFYSIIECVLFLLSGKK
jgi:hypothetical protein